MQQAAIYGHDAFNVVLCSAFGLAMFACYGATILLDLLNACDIRMKDRTILSQGMLQR